MSLASLRWPYAPTLMLVGAVVFLSACQPFYVLEAGYEQLRIIQAREPIHVLLESPELPAVERQKLELVLAARDFAAAMGLDPGRSFTTFSRLQRPWAAWVVMASRPLSFELYHWWFPIVGSVPYKGYFSEGAAERSAARLERQGWESWVRGTDAFSTLGWFADPLLSPTLRLSPELLVNIVIHESLHQSIWIKGDVIFNESLAHFVGVRGAVDFFKSRLASGCSDAGCPGDPEQLLAAARRHYKFELFFSGLIWELYQELQELYRAEESDDYKLTQRQIIFSRYRAALKQHYPTAGLLTIPNNAAIMQLAIYRRDFHHWAELFAAQGESWPKFLAKARSYDPLKLRR